MAAEHRNPLFAKLHEVTIREIIPADQKLVTLKASDSLEHAVKVLADNKILSAPVMDDDNQPLFFIDAVDISKYIANAAPEKSELHADYLTTLKTAGRAIALQSLEQVWKLTGGDDAVVTAFEGNPASELVDLLTGGIHRVALTNKEGEVVGIASQSDVARYLSQFLHMGHLKETGEKTLAELGYGHCKLETIKATHSVLHAIKKLQKKHVTALAVVGDNGHLIANFSASDLRGLYRERIPEFLTPIGEFLEAHSPASGNPVVITPENTLIEAVKEMVNSKLHHLWILDDFKPSGIMSLTDLMKIAAAQA